MYGMFRNHFDYGFYKKFEDEYKQCCKEAREQRTKESGKEQEAEKLNRQQTKLIRTIVVLVALSILLYFSNLFNCAWFAGLLVIAVAALSIYSLVKFICLNKKYNKVFSETDESQIADERLDLMTQFFTDRQILTVPVIESLVDHYETQRDDIQKTGDDIAKLITVVGTVLSTIFTVFMKDAVIKLLTTESIGAGWKDVLCWILVIVFEIPVLAFAIDKQYFQSKWDYTHYTLLEDLQMLQQNVKSGGVYRELTGGRMPAEFPQSYVSEGLRQVDDDYEKLQEFVRRHTREHGSYYHYTSFDNVKRILESGGFLFSDMSSDNINDKNESSKFAANQFFAMSFSHDIHENLGMWYLYSGNEQNGARLALNQNDFLRIFEKERFKAFLKNKDGDCIPIDDFDKDWGVRIQDVLYRKMPVVDPNGKVTFYYDEVEDTIFPAEKWNKYSEGNALFIKDIIWKNELETKVVIYPKSDKAKKMFKENKKYWIFVKPEHDICDTNFIHIHLGPETDNDNSIPNAVMSYYTNQIHMRHGKCGNNRLEKNAKEEHK